MFVVVVVVVEVRNMVCCCLGFVTYVGRCCLVWFVMVYMVIYFMIKT